MANYSELIKNFEKIRAYMRDFYVYGFKNREQYDRKSARSYDDERRRVESWLGEHMRFTRTPEGKTVFLSIDSRSSGRNPFFRAWKTKSFTDGDITLHFILLDILHSPDVALSLADLTERIDRGYLACFAEPMVFDESTLRKKLKEYCNEGILTSEKRGKHLVYRRAPETDLADCADALDFFSEAAPCGAIGSFLIDKQPPRESRFSFKHHYITGALDQGVLAALFSAMREKRAVTVTNHSRKSDEPRKNRIIPLRIFISVQSGRQHLLAYQPVFNCIKAFRLDYLSDVKPDEPSPRFDELRAALDRMQGSMWGVSTGGKKRGTEHITFTVRVGRGEEYIVQRLFRERRIGRVERVDEEHYRFSADVIDASELAPWIRTFLCRITSLSCSNPAVEERIRTDLQRMYRMYGVEEVEE